MNIDEDKIDEAVLALLWLNAEAAGSAWKGFDWPALSRLHERGLISNPASKTKSARFTRQGDIEGERLFRELFTRS
jgi:hypothetical protein